MTRMSLCKFILISLVIAMLSTSCSSEDASAPSFSKQERVVVEKEAKDEGLPNINLDNWKVTLPIGNPTEVEPPDIEDYSTNPVLMKYMYNSLEDTSLVFYTEPGSSTANSKYSRTELREQMEPGSNSVNWTFEEGGKMKGKLRVARVSGVTGDHDRIIVMQIHGRLTNEQRDLIGEDDHNAPPVLKIYWDDGIIDVRRKILKNVDVSAEDILRTSSWKDESHLFQSKVGFEPFNLEIIASDSVLKITLNNGEEEIAFDDIHTQKWRVFENYFKAGNYLQTSESGTFSEVRFYELEVSH